MKKGTEERDGKTVRPPQFAAKLPPAPKAIKRPCDYGLDSAVQNLEIQLGTIEAYNRLVTAATKIKDQIDKGMAKPANPLYLASLRGGPMPPQQEISEI